jgi:WD40 repeat protein
MDDDQVILQSRDGQDFKVEYKVIKQSVTIKNLIEDAGVADPIPVPNITGKTLAKIIEFLKLLHEGKGKDIDLTLLLEQDLLAFTIAVNYLDAPILFDAAINECARRIFTDDLFEKLRDAKIYENYKQNFLDRFSKDLQHAIINRGQLYLISNRTLKLLATFKASPLVALATDTFTAVAFSPDNRKIAIGGAHGSINLWNNEPSANPQWLQRLNHANQRIDAIAFSPDSTRIVTAAAGGTGKLWDATQQQFQPLATFPHERVRAVAFSPDGTQIATASADDTIKLWENAPSQDPQPLTIFPTEHNRMRTGMIVKSVVFSPDGTRIATVTSDGLVEAWENKPNQKPRRLSTFPGLDFIVRIIGGRILISIVFIDDTHIAIASLDGVVKLWEISKDFRYQLCATLHMGKMNAIAFSPDGTRMVTVAKDVAGLWQLVDPNFLKNLNLASAQIVAYVNRNEINELPAYLQQGLNVPTTEVLFPTWYQRAWNWTKDKSKWIIGGAAAATGGYLLWKKSQQGE